MKYLRLVSLNRFFPAIFKANWFMQAPSNVLILCLALKKIKIIFCHSAVPQLIKLTTFFLSQTIGKEEHCLPLVLAANASICHCLWSHYGPLFGTAHLFSIKNALSNKGADSNKSPFLPIL